LPIIFKLRKWNKDPIKIEAVVGAGIASSETSRCLRIGLEDYDTGAGIASSKKYRDTIW